MYLRLTVGLWIAAAPLLAQGRVLDVVDGETLYEGGFLVAISSELQREESLRAGNSHVADATASHQFTSTSTLALQYGLRHDLQVGIALPYVDTERESIAGQQVAAGLGDIELLAKWRFHRWDAHAVSINSALIGSLSLPTGDDDRRMGGSELEPELQAGSGGIDPSLGIAITPEPGRWRFNAAVLYTWHTDTDHDGDRRGDAFFGEVAIGNRFWLEPYPGPFMRLDVFAHYYHDAKDEIDDVAQADTGGERVALGATWAFRPRPSIDLQVTGEVPVWRDVNGQQLDEDWSALVSLGYRF
ncbi:MAG TPA: transporter [Planctomycetota bacterium]|nr:transporter [Planctomycetota bacterium]